MNSYYGLISNTIELKALDKTAREKGKRAVGVTKKGNAYVWDDDTKQAIIVDNITVATILECDLELADKILNSKGKYRIKEEVKEEVITQEEPAVDEEDSWQDCSSDECDNSIEEYIIASLDELSKTNDKLDRIENKIDSLIEAINLE